MPSGPLQARPATHEAWRERVVTPLLIGALVMAPLAQLPALLSAQSPVLNVIYAAVYVVLALAAVVRWSYQLRIGAFLLALYVLGVGAMLTTATPGGGIFFLLAFVVMSALMLSPRAGAGAATISVLTVGLLGWLSLANWLPPIRPEAPSAGLQDWIVAGAMMLLFGIVTSLGLHRLLLELTESQRQAAAAVQELDRERDSVENDVEQRTRRARRLTEIGREVTASLDTGQVMAHALEAVAGEFDCYYAALFLLDSAEKWAELRDATGDAGQVLKQNNYRLDVGGRSVVSLAIQEKQASFGPGGSGGPARLENPLLPYTRSEVALPLMIDGTVLGALDLHSSKEGAFRAADVDALVEMANQIAISLKNAQLFQEAQQSLAELRAAQNQYLQGAWAALSGDADLDYSLGEPGAGGRSAQIDVPLTLRDQIIGQISMASEQDWTAEQRTFIESIAAQAALALENARLMQESQATAARERLIADITTKIWAAATMEAILQTAVRELGRAFETSEATIELNSEAWREFRASQTPAYQYTLAGVRPFSGGAADSKQVRDGHLQVPLILRGGAIGTITLQRKLDSAQWTELERELVEKIAGQVALALDNSRLIEDVQKNARRNELLASVSAHVRETLDMDSIMQTAAREFVRALNLSEAEIRLASPTLLDAATDAVPSALNPPERRGD